MNELVKDENIKVEDMIYEIRGKQVMLDRDLAKLYRVETKRINEAVKNNLDKFPERFSWQLTNEEKNILWSKFSTANINSKSRSNPRVFTEQGVAMLSTILKSKVATKVSINIMDAFVAMRKYISNNLVELNYINNKLLEHDANIKLLQESFDKLNKDKMVCSIFFEGQIYDAYSLLLDIFNKTKNELIIIDNYANKELLDILKNIDKKIIIVSKNIDNELIKKYKLQYENIEFINNDTFHDRFIIIDNNKLYHCGSSFKDLGKKCFAISEMDDEKILKDLLGYLNR